MEKEMDFGDIVLDVIHEGKTPLPVFNPIAIKVQQLVERKPDLSEIIDTVSVDSKLSAAVLQAVNSPFYGLGVKKKTVSDAIYYLGLEESGNVVVSAALSGNFSSKDKQMQPYMAKLWKHNLGCAIGCQWLSNSLEKEMNSTAFLAGMLHDFGKLTLLSAIEKVKRDKRLSLIPITDRLICETLSKLHTEQGFRTLTKMNLPEEYCVVARDHHLPQEHLEKEDRLLVFVRTADMICNEVGLGVSEDVENMEWREVEGQAFLGLEQEIIEECKAYTKEKMRIS